MITVVVWVLVMTYRSYGSSPLVVDNIASAENCRALAQTISRNHPEYVPETRKGYMDRGLWSCTAVRKARP